MLYPSNLYYMVFMQFQKEWQSGIISSHNMSNKMIGTFRLCINVSLVCKSHKGMIKFGLNFG